MLLKKQLLSFIFFRNFKQRGDELELKIELIKLHNKGFVYFLNCRVSRLFLTEPLNLMCHSVFLKSGEKEVSGVFGPGARFSKVPKTFRARKAIRETPTCLICKAGLFICCIGNTNQNNCKVSFLETPSF